MELLVLVSRLLAREEERSFGSALLNKSFPCRKNKKKNSVAHPSNARPGVRCALRVPAQYGQQVPATAEWPAPAQFVANHQTPDTGGKCRIKIPK